MSENAALAKRCRLSTDIRNYSKKRILVQDRGGHEVQTGGAAEQMPSG